MAALAWASGRSCAGCGWWGYRLRRADGAYQLSAANAGLHHYFYRFGLFMKFDRLQLLAFVVPVWAVNITFSLFWLRHFRQGPVEWLWRQLTLRASGTSLKNTSR
ncbi:hypothetical protein UA70_00175 [Raoultella planticola]|nr:hypothetical protein UA70_00175 [Raoultella planticola]